MNDLKIYLPKIYSDVVEIESVVTADSSVLAVLETEVQNTLKDQFVSTATARGVSMFESMLNIHPKPTDLLELRKQRVLSRLSTTPPLTFGSMDEHLAQIIGEGNYVLEIDYALLKLTVRVKIPAKQFFEEANILVAEVAPANLLLDVTLQYNTHEVLSSYTHAQLAAYTHYELREEVL